MVRQTDIGKLSQSDGLQRKSEVILMTNTLGLIADWFKEKSMSYIFLNEI